MSGNTSRSPVLIAVVAVAIGLLVLLNIFQQRNDPKYQEEMAKQAAREQAKKAAENQPKPTADVGPANELAGYGADKTLGNPAGSPKITVGWEWTPTVQGDPSKVYNAVQAALKAAPGASVRVVNLDANPGAVPAGVASDGKVMVPPAPDGSLVPEAVTGVLGKAAAPAGSAAAPPPPGPAPATP